MRENFAASLAAVLKHEGGYVDHPKDPGGATNMGITHKTLARWRNVSPWWNLGKGEIKNLSKDEAAKIYKANYWDEINGDELPSGVDYAVFDFAVNSGPARSAIYLQNLVGTAPDGKIGPLTVKAVEGYCSRFGAVQFVNELCSHRLAFLQQLSTWPTFGRGWEARVAGVRAMGTDMAKATPPKHPIDLPDTPEPAAPAKRKTLVDLLRELFVRQAANHVVSTMEKNGMNTNLLHNLMNIAIAIVAILSLPEVVAVLPPELGVVIAGAIGILKTLINLFRDGPTGLFKQQPPVR